MRKNARKRRRTSKNQEVVQAHREPEIEMPLYEERQEPTKDSVTS